MKHYLKKQPPGRETLERVKKYPSVRKYWAGSQVRIVSKEHGAFWRPNAAGYTINGLEAGVYSFEEAFRLTGHCDPSKRIEFSIV